MVKNKILSKIPNTTGIYKIKDRSDRIIYIGKALRIKDRIKSHLNNTSSQMRNYISDVDIIEVSSEVEALILEASLIQKLQPKFNINLRDDKSFLYIIITDEEFPRVLSDRKSDSLPVLYKFGPFPSSKTVRDFLKMIRKIFPYCTQSSKSKRICFYSYLNLCAPCPAFIKRQPKDDYKKYRRLYLRNIKNIVDLMNGNISSIKNSLNKQIAHLAKKQLFEEADKIHRQITQLDYITKPYYKIDHFLEDPNFLDKEIEKRLLALVDLIKPYFFNFKKADRIEGVDISNISGEHASGSLVVFTNGYKDSSLYKRFKIRSKGPNDALMIKEVIERRLKHDDWGFPDLFVVDGGIPQVSEAYKVIKNYKKNIALIGIAKKLETIVVPNNDKFVLLNISKNNDVLRLIQEIRDESHRFAQKYYHNLKRKVFLNQ